MKPIFVGGCPRSGTTLVGSLLAAAVRGLVTPETHFKQRILSRFIADPSLSLSADELRKLLGNEEELAFWPITLSEVAFPDRITATNIAETIKAIAAAYQWRAHGQPVSDVWVDHTPLNVKTTHLLQTFFPDALFVHVIRDPRGVAASVLPLPWGPNETRELIAWWSDFVAHGFAAEQNPNHHCIRVRYEDVISDPQHVVSQLCQSLGLPFDGASLGVSVYQPPAYSEHQHALIGQVPQANRALAWRDELHPLAAWRIGRQFSDLLLALGYPGAPMSKPLVSWGSSLVWWVKEKSGWLRGSLNRKVMRRYRRVLRKKALEQSSHAGRPST